MRNLYLKLLAGLVAVATFASAGSADALSLYGSAWQVVGDRYGIDPILLYAVALVESGRRTSGWIAPTEYAVRTPKGAYYGISRTDAVAKLATLSASDSEGSDLGIMQVNVRWHRHRVRSVGDLLDPVTNLTVAGYVLAEAIASAPENLELGIGRYHSWNVSRARPYGRRVLKVYRRLTGMATPPPLSSLWE